MRKQMKKREGILRILLRKLVKFSKRKLFWNKIWSITFMIFGYLTIGLLEGDGTIFILSLILGLPVFFAKKNYIDIKLNYEEIERII